MKKLLISTALALLFAVLLSACMFVTPFHSCNITINTGESEETDFIVQPSGDYEAMILWGGELYVRAYDVSIANTSSLILVGETTSYTDTVPAKDGETNFSRKTGLPVARYGDYLAVKVNSDSEWYLFLKEGIQMNENAVGYYTREKGGFGGTFSLALNENGGYQYYEGFLSSYIGIGTWELEDGIVTMHEATGYEKTFQFKVTDEGLRFIAEGSSTFLYVKVEDGDLFRPSNAASDIPSEESLKARSADSYMQITQEQAKEMMARDDGHLIVDVRRQDEFDEGHIPGAICIPNESIETEKPAELPDLDQILLIYCRSGRRSKEAAQKLFDMGYTNVYEFGGIIDWTGEVEK